MADLENRVAKSENDIVKLFDCVNELRKESKENRESNERQNKLLEGLCEQQRETNATLKGVAEILLAWNNAKGAVSFFKWLSGGAKTIIPIVTVIGMILAFIKFFVLAG